MNTFQGKQRRLSCLWRCFVPSIFWSRRFQRQGPEGLVFVCTGVTLPSQQTRCSANTTRTEQSLFALATLGANGDGDGEGEVGQRGGGCSVYNQMGPEPREGPGRCSLRHAA